MTRLVKAGAEFGELFRRFERSAWRWEAQGTYREPDETEPWERWRQGDRDVEWMRSWLDEIAAATAAGKAFRRVRMQTEPLTEYLRWQADVTPHNIAAGEDIRLLTEQDAQDLGMPAHDFWLFDDEQVAVLRFGGAGLDAAEIITAPDVVERHLVWRDLAWTHATPFGERRIE